MGGIMPYTDFVRNVAKAVKAVSDPYLYGIIADSLMSAVTENSVIVPAPNHCGKACYTLEIARVLSKRTGARIEDVLFSLPRETLYSLKQKGKDASYTMYLRHGVKGEDILFLDNVIDTGATFKKAKALIPTLKPLVYATTGRVRYGSLVG